MTFSYNALFTFAESVSSGNGLPRGRRDGWPPNPYSPPTCAAWTRTAWRG